MRPEDLRGDAARAYENWRALGLTEDAALREAMQYQGAPQPDTFDQLVEAFRGLGLSAAFARECAIGRDGSEYEARRLFAESSAACERDRVKLSEEQR